MLHRYRLLMIIVPIVMLLVSSTIGVSAKALAPTNLYGPLTVTVVTRCPNVQAIVNVPISQPIQSIDVSGQVKGSLHLYDHNGLINTNVTGSAPYSFFTTRSDVLYACLTSGSNGTVSFAGQINMVTGNWAGYTAQALSASPNEYTDLVGFWQVPSVSCSLIPLENSSSATWIGFGGAPNTGSSKIEQIGTEQDCLAGIPAYYPVYENLPAPKIRILSACSSSNLNSCINVHALVYANDTIEASIHYYSNSGIFTLILQDNTRNWYAKELYQSNDPSIRYSAEWIEEAPAASMTNFHQVNFTMCYVDGYPLSHGGASVQQLTIKSGSTIKAQPSSLSETSAEGDIFNVQFKNH